MFGKLGQYRQKIKGNPGIIYIDEDERLSAVKKLEEGKSDLEKFLAPLAPAAFAAK